MFGESSGRNINMLVHCIPLRVEELKLDMFAVFLRGCAKTLLGHYCFILNQERLLVNSLQQFQAWSRIIILDKETFILAQTPLGLRLSIVRFDSKLCSLRVQLVQFDASYGTELQLFTDIVTRFICCCIQTAR